NHGGDLVRLFPKGSGGAQSEAKSEIWSDMEGFNRRAVAMTAAVATPVALSSSIKQPALSEQFKSVGGACSACHRQFRAKKI
ncbi:MAG: cytochrome c, partial [Pseudomonadota bacterium]|nr:cytochrome c [Pseudomonadota bacterium]